MRKFFSFTGAGRKKRFTFEKWHLNMTRTRTSLAFRANPSRVSECRGTRTVVWDERKPGNGKNDFVKIRFGSFCAFIASD